MKVVSRPVQLELPDSLYPRSEGVHQSAIIRAIAIEEGILKPEWDEDASFADKRAITDPDAITRICMGLAWEEWYIRTQLPLVVDHPGELCVDDIFMTPDGEELTQIVIESRDTWIDRIHEVKLTYKSMKTVGWSRELFDTAWTPGVGPLTTQWMWLAQIKGYCHARQTRYATLHVLFACGDYSWPQRPKPFVYDLEFTDMELERNWTLLRDYKDYRLTAGV